MSSERDENSSMAEESSEGTSMLNGTCGNYQAPTEVPNLIFDLDLVKAENQPEWGFSANVVLTVKMPRSVPGEPSMVEPRSDVPLTNEQSISEEPIGNKQSISDEPIRNEQSISDEPIRNEQSISDEPIRNEQSISDEPIRNEQSISDEQMPNEQSISDEAITNEQSNSTVEPN